MRRRKSDTKSLIKTTSVERAVLSIFVLGNTTSRTVSQDKFKTQEPVDYTALNMEELGGVEYRALRVLLEVAIGKLNCA
jgi:hypothetical protein